eukprot:127400_1
MLAVFVCLLLSFYCIYSIQIEKWDQFEISFPNGPQNGNPFMDYIISANFTFINNTKNSDNLPFIVDGFYDGNGKYLIRFMPNQIGIWSYKVTSNIISINGKYGSFECIPATSNNLGPIVSTYKLIDNTTQFIRPHFIYFESKKPFYQTGTTAYGITHTSLELQNITMNTVKNLRSKNIFNKIRFLIFPQYYMYSRLKPLYFPYLGSKENNFYNFTQFDVRYWQNLDKMIKTFQSHNMISDVILFSNYSYGFGNFDCIGGTNSSNYNITMDLFYIKYLVSRLASYRLVWYSMANEFDLVNCKNKGKHNKPPEFPIWDAYFKYLLQIDPYRNPVKQKSIHQSSLMYNYSQPWTTHFSIQGYQNVDYKNLYNKYNV